MSSTTPAKPTAMTAATPLRRPSPNRRRLIGRTALWSAAAVAVVLKVTLPIF
ncbi:hypothetical protein [Phenylobacterium sp.]|jgi:type VI protein secretion system component VasF|uniref:hypothetical protein n=1 Tax=Phenylobacterium sp. TaxID=1871053 RepID=UPI002F927DB1